MSDMMAMALSGMRTATGQFTTAATNIVTATASPQAGDDLPAQFVAMSQARTAFIADVAVAKVADRMTKSLLDILA